jgi:hypothetical protein
MTRGFDRNTPIVDMVVPSGMPQYQGGQEICFPKDAFFIKSIACQYERPAKKKENYCG